MPDGTLCLPRTRDTSRRRWGYLTIDARISLGFGIAVTLRFRLAGIDCPEVYGPNASESGKEAAQFTRQWVDDRAGQLVLHSYKGSRDTVGIGDGAFGRWLGTVVDANNNTLSDALTEAGYTKEDDS